MGHTQDQIKVLDQMGEDLNAEMIMDLENRAESEAMSAMHESGTLQPEDI